MSAVLRPRTLHIRPMDEADLDAVHAVERDAYRFPWTRGILGDCLRVGYSCWVIERYGAVKGHGILQIAAGDSHILNLCIAVEAQGQGLGRTLLDHLIEVAVEHRATICLLEVRPTNHAACALYRSAGFNEVGMRRAYYPGVKGREDAVILARNL